MLVQLNGKGSFHFASHNNSHFVLVHGIARLVKFTDNDEAFVVVDGASVLVTWF